MIRRRAKHWMNGHLLTSTQPRRAKKWTLAIIFFQNSSTNSYTNRPVLLLSDPRKCAGSCTKANLLRSANVWKLHELAIVLFSTQTQLKAISIIFQIQVPPVGIPLSSSLYQHVIVFHFGDPVVETSLFILYFQAAWLPSGASHGPCTFHEPSQWCGNHHRSRRLGWALLGSPKGGCCCWAPHHH